MRSHKLYIVSLLLLYTRAVESLECFNCKAVTDLSACYAKVTCSDGQVCYNNRHNTGQQVYHLGCSNIKSAYYDLFSLQYCRNPDSIASTIVGRDISERQTQDCHKCCSANLCNRNMCGHTDVFSDCKDIHSAHPTSKSGIYSVNLWQSKRTINVFCDMDTDNGGWTVFQHRVDGSVDFYRNFSAYEQGFGNLSTEYWLGLRDIQELASQGQTDLRIDLESANGSKGFETFQKFHLSPRTAYTLHIGSTIASSRISKYFSESVGPYHNGHSFSTYDHDVDGFGSSCAVKFHGAWWYDSCYYANLNGPYITPGIWTEKAIRYKSFFDYTSLKSVTMMMRRR